MSGLRLSRTNAPLRPLDEATFPEGRVGKGDRRISQSDLAPYLSDQLEIDLRDWGKFQATVPNVSRSVFDALLFYERAHGNGDQRVSFDETIRFNDRQTLWRERGFIKLLKEIEQKTRDLAPPTAFDFRRKIVPKIWGYLHRRYCSLRNARCAGVPAHDLENDVSYKNWLDHQRIVDPAVRLLTTILDHAKDLAPPNAYDQLRIIVTLIRHHKWAEPIPEPPTHPPSKPIAPRTAQEPNVPSTEGGCGCSLGHRF